MYILYTIQESDGSCNNEYPSINFVVITSIAKLRSIIKEKIKSITEREISKSQLQIVVNHLIEENYLKVSDYYVYLSSIEKNECYSVPDPYDFCNAKILSDIIIEPIEYEIENPMVTDIKIHMILSEEISEKSKILSTNILLDLEIDDLKCDARIPYLESSDEINKLLKECDIQILNWRILNFTYTKHYFERCVVLPCQIHTNLPQTENQYNLESDSRVMIERISQRCISISVEDDDESGSILYEIYKKLKGQPRQVLICGEIRIPVKIEFICEL